MKIILSMTAAENDKTFIGLKDYEIDLSATDLADNEANVKRIVDNLIAELFRRVAEKQARSA